MLHVVSVSAKIPAEQVNDVLQTMSLSDLGDALERLSVTRLQTLVSFAEFEMFKRQLRPDPMIDAPHLFEGVS